MSASAARRSWTPAHERKLGALVSAVEFAIEQGEDPEAAVKAAVLKAAKASSMQELADRIGTHRPNLSETLAGKTPGYDIRRALDREIGLPPGGMERVLSLLEQPGA